MNLRFGWLRVSHQNTSYILRHPEYRETGDNSEYLGSWMSTQNFPMFWWNIQQYSWNTSACCATLLCRVFLLLQHRNAVFSFILSPVEPIRGFVFIVLSSPKFMFQDFAKVESHNLGWKSGLCNNFTFVTLANSCGTQGHAPTGAESGEEELIARQGNYHVLTNVWSRNLK